MDDIQSLKNNKKSEIVEDYHNEYDEDNKEMKSTTKTMKTSDSNIVFTTSPRFTLMLPLDLSRFDVLHGEAFEGQCRSA